MIHHHIDLGTVLRGAVCALYSNLVTRPTGAAVRTAIERSIAENGGRTVTVIDFSQVMLLDFSCADEIVAKLMLRYARRAESERTESERAEIERAETERTATECREPARADGEPIDGADGYFLFRGLGEHHLDAVEAVLERHGLAIVAVIDGAPTLVGDVDADVRHAWELLRELGPCDAEAVARAGGAAGAEIARRLDVLAERRLVVRVGAAYAVLGAFPAPVPEAAA